jgi:ABC-type transport system involved in multi-copper enzyme maturation permease subunit
LTGNRGLPGELCEVFLTILCLFYYYFSCLMLFVSICFISMVANSTAQSPP